MKKNLNTSELRLRLIILIFLSITLFLAYRYSTFMFFNDISYISPKNINTIQKRGIIYDRFGEIIGFSSKSYSVGAFPKKIDNIVNTSETLGAILDLDPLKLKEKLSEKKDFIYIKRKLKREESDLIERIQYEGRLQNVSLYPDYTRIYPFRSLTSNITGFVGTDNIGLTGLEFSLNSILSADETKQEFLDEEVKLNNVYLTIDINLQKGIDKIARKYFEENSPENMITIVADAKNGEILSMLQYPKYDANYYNKYESNLWKNFAVESTYEPGSVNKVFTVAILLDSGKLSTTETFLDNGIYEKKFKSGEIVKIKTLNPPYKNIDATGILIYSSNVGIAYITEKVSNKYFYDKLLDFGFGQKVGLPFPGETKGILSHYSKWSGRSKATIGFGQEIGASTIQMIQAATALSNNGIMLKPQIIKKITNESEKTIKEFKAEEVRKVISSSASKEILKMMRDVVNKGGLPNLKIDGLNISAKSGTSQVIDKDTGKYSDDDYTASILSIYPTENPKYIIYIVYRYPKKMIYGTRIAAPMAREIIEFIEEKNKQKEYSKIKVKSKFSIPKTTIKYNYNKEYLPNLIGLSKRDLISIIEEFKNEKMKITINGNGFVYEQSISPNTRLEDISELEIKLK